MGNHNIYFGETPETSFTDKNGNWIGDTTNISPELSPKVELDHKKLTYEVNTKHAAKENSKRLKEYSLKSEAGISLMLRYPLVIESLPLPTKVIGDRIEPIPFCLEGAYPSLKLININKDAPAALWLEDKEQKTSYIRTKIPRVILKNLLISSKSTGVLIQGLGYQLKLDDVHFVGCKLGLDLKDLYSVSLGQNVTYMQDCDTGFYLERIGSGNIGLIRSGGNKMGGFIRTCGNLLGGIVCEGNSVINFDIDTLLNSIFTLYHEGFTETPPTASNSKIMKSKFTDFRIVDEHLPNIDMDQETLEHCSFNGKFKNNGSTILDS